MSSRSTIDRAMRRRSGRAVAVVAAVTAASILPALATGGAATAAGAAPARATAAGGPVVTAADVEGKPLSASVQRQIEAIASEKAARTPDEQKVDSNLLFAARQAAGGTAAVQGVPALDTGVEQDAAGEVVVDIDATVGRGVLSRIKAAGGTIVNVVPGFDAIRARVPLDAVVAIAADPAVRNVRPGDEFETSKADAPTGGSGGAATSSVGAGENEADTTQNAIAARSAYGLDGTGVKACAISNGVATLPLRQASGDLPDVDILPGQAGSGDEGTAMLELIHDIAPGATLGYATANPSTAQFAQNILDLQASGCKVIVDDINYFSERTFQDGNISQAISTVKSKGTIYFTAATNSGNLPDGTSGTWQGDFSDGGAAGSPFPAGYKLHQWAAGITQDVITSGSNSRINLEWADPTGGSSNDYDLYVLNSSGTSIVAQSTNVQNGNDDPQEATTTGNTTNNRVVVLKASAAASRYLALYTNRGKLATATGGAARGHNGSIDAVSVAATPARTKFNSASPAGPYVSPGVGQHTGANTSEIFSSDGPIRVFFKKDGTAITPGNFTYTGGQGINGPDVTGADGVTSTTPGFIPFFGTSAASPNVAAIAALALQAKPTTTPAALEAAMKASALDIEAAGVDPVAGNGIVMAPALMANLGVAAHANVQAAALTKTVSSGDGDGAFEPGETVDLSQVLKNAGATSATGISAKLTSASADATVVNSTVTYANLAPGASGSPSGGPLRFEIAKGCACGSILKLTITVTYAGGHSPTAVIPVRILVGTPAAVTDVAYAGAPVAIPDGTGATGTANLTVGNVGRISDLTFSIDGSSCASSSTVGIDHTYFSDLTATLESPSGTVSTLFSGIGNAGDNMCQAVFSDAGSTPIQTRTASGNVPFTGTWKPASPLSVFDGENPQGTWKLRVFDSYSQDAGNIRAFSLHVQTASCDIFGPNTAPVATADTYRAVRNKALTKSAALGVLANDTDEDGDALTAAVVTAPAHGTVALSGNGGFTYTPAANYVGADSFTYRANDGAANSTPATVSIAVQTPTQAFVEQVFLDFVGRLADSGGLTFWTNRLDKGTETHASFAKQMARSHEYSVKVVTRAYLDVLGRATDPSGREYWANKVQKGMPISTLVLNLIGSSEYLKKTGGTVSGFVDATFQAILGRQPTASERTAKVNAINGGTSRRQVALDLYNTTESKRRRTKVQFQLLLHRDPTSAEYTSWTSKLTTQSDADLAIALAATNEYYVNAQTT